MKLSRRLGLDRPDLRAWAMYDWANSAYVTVIIGAVFPIYFATVACQQDPPLDASVASGRFTLTTSIAMAFVAVLSPILGAIADRAPVKKRMIAIFATAGALAAGGLAFVGPGDWVLGAVLFGLGNVCVTASFVAYDALLPLLARDDELDRVSSAGYAIGYLGGGLLLAFDVLLIQKHTMFGIADKGDATRLAFVTVAVWWIVFAIPLYRRVREPPVAPRPARGNLVVATFRDVASTFRSLRKYKQATLMLVAFLLYNDGIGTIIRVATTYGAEIGLDTGTMITAFLIVQFIGIPFTFVFGALAGKIGARPAIFCALCIYAVVSVLGYYMTSSLHFFLLAMLVGIAQGGAQALSRSLFASMIPRQRAGEFFGLFAVFDKFAGIFGPLLFAATVTLLGSSRPAILSLIGFFVVGGILLALVDVEKGQQQAREEETAIEAGAA
jgi:UMF1 family MFS transporter